MRIKKLYKNSLYTHISDASNNVPEKKETKTLGGGEEQKSFGLLPFQE